MAKARVDFKPVGVDGLKCSVETRGGKELTLAGSLKDVEPSATGDETLASNTSLITNLWAYGLNEKLSRKLRNEDKRKSHAKQAERHLKVVKLIAGVVDDVETDSRQGWCSSCLTNAPHGKTTRPGTYVCGACGSVTNPCPAPLCKNMASRVSAAAPPRYCAEHRHDLPSFAAAEMRIPDLDHYEALTKFAKANLSRNTTMGIVAGAGIAVTAATFGAAAPAIGGAIGSLSIAGGYSGAAAVSHGLAILGGGAIAAGGAGMAGGTLVVTAAGAVLGGGVGMSVASAYTSTDKSFKIEEVRGGKGTPVVVINGFLTEANDTWSAWKRMVDERYPDAPVYRVHWGAKELGTLAAVIGGGIGKQGLYGAVVGGARKGMKVAGKKLGPAAAIFAAADVITNPWHTAKNRADMTGAALAALIAHTETPAYVLMGHSLGARVAAVAGAALGTDPNAPRLQEVHLMGAAVAAKRDWRSLSEAVDGKVFNYFSSNDGVLRNLYQVAEAGVKPAGLVGFKSAYPNIVDRNVSRTVKKHSQYFEKVTLS